MGKKYHDKEWLQEKYVDEGMTLAEIADICGVATATIHNWVGKHDIPRRSRSESLRKAHGSDTGKYNDRDWLYEQYVEQERSGIDIANECGVHHDTVYKRLEEHGIDRRSVKEATNVSDEMGFEGRDHPAWDESVVPFYTHKRDSYECWRHNWDGESHSVFVHRLVAVAEYGFDEVCDKHVHHDNEIRWDNRPENLEVVTNKEHLQIHKERGAFSNR